MASSNVVSSLMCSHPCEVRADGPLGLAILPPFEEASRFPERQARRCELGDLVVIVLNDQIVSGKCHQPFARFGDVAIPLCRPPLEGEYESCPHRRTVRSLVKLDKRVYPPRLNGVASVRNVGVVSAVLTVPPTSPRRA